jgi:hypothetical protein
MTLILVLSLILTLQRRKIGILHTAPVLAMYELLG